ncbi:MAG TPA: hypothetical protein VGO70_05860 [Arsenicitalea sp.]|jgi:hypothetical protein|nr:hypothetical protein [Arsenicitalea sp.]
MSEPQVVNTLRSKAESLAGYIAKLEADIEQARADLSHVVATLHLFEAPADGSLFPMHYNLDRLFKRREIGQLCLEALAEGPRNTRQLADWIIAQKQFPGPDRHLRSSIAYRIVQALRMQERRGGQILRTGKDGNAIRWRLVDPAEGSTAPAASSPSRAVKPGATEPQGS